MQRIDTHQGGLGGRAQNLANLRGRDTTRARPAFGMSAFDPEGVIMSLTGLEVFDETLHKTNTWLKEIGEMLGSDRHGAYQALRAVLHCLRDRLTIDEAAHLGEQLPMLIRGIYYEAWRPAGKPEKIRSREEFLALIGTRLPNKALLNREDAVRAVFQTLETHVSAGEIGHVVHSLPKEIRVLWPVTWASSGPVAK